MKIMSVLAWILLGIYAVMLAGCTTSAPSETVTDMTGNVVDVSSGFISSSSPDSIFADYARAEEFVRRNFVRIKFDMAVGEGEYVSALAVLLKVPAVRQEEFCSLTKQRFGVLYPTATTSPAEMLARLKREVELHFSGSQDSQIKS